MFFRLEKLHFPGWNAILYCMGNYLKRFSDAALQGRF
jgi:hypothetical protein